MVRVAYGSWPQKTSGSGIPSGTISTKIEIRLLEITENLHRADLSVLERDEQIAEWAQLIKLKEVQAEPSDKSRQDDEGSADGARASDWLGAVAKKSQEALASRGGRGKKGGRSQAARKLALNEQKIRRAEKVAGITPEAKEAAREAGLADNQRALLQVADAPANEQVEAVKVAAKRKQQAAKTEPHDEDAVGAEERGRWTFAPSTTERPKRQRMPV